LAVVDICVFPQATLTGALDVVAVEHDDGSITCTPFHVRFGRSAVYHAEGQPVEMRVNGFPVALTIRVRFGGSSRPRGRL